MVTDEVIVGRAEPGLMVHGPAPELQPLSLSGILNVIVFESLAKFAALIASRKLQCDTRQAPLSTSSVVLTTSVAGGASSFTIVRVLGLGEPRIAPVAADNVR